MIFKKHNIYKLIASPHNRFSFSLIFHGAVIQKLVCTENIQKLPNKTIICLTILKHLIKVSQLCDSLH